MVETRVDLIIWGTFMGYVNDCFAEMVTYPPLPSPFVGFTSELIDGALGFALAWNFFLNMAIFVPLKMLP